MNLTKNFSKVNLKFNIKQDLNNSTNMSRVFNKSTIYKTNSKEKILKEKNPFEQRLKDIIQNK